MRPLRHPSALHTDVPVLAACPGELVLADEGVALLAATERRESWCIGSPRPDVELWDAARLRTDPEVLTADTERLVVGLRERCEPRANRCESTLTLKEW